MSNQVTFTNRPSSKPSLSFGQLCERIADEINRLVGSNNTKPSMRWAQAGYENVTVKSCSNNETHGFLIGLLAMYYKAEDEERGSGVGYIAFSTGEDGDNVICPCNTEEAWHLLDFLVSIPSLKNVKVQISIDK